MSRKRKNAFRAFSARSIPTHSHRTRELPSTCSHHAFAAEFDRTKPVKFKGTLNKVEWVNPHVWVHIDVLKPDGKMETWAFEAGTPSVLFRRGFTRKSLLPGTVVVIDGYRAKDGSRRANGRDITFEDGSKLFMGSSGIGAPYELNQKQTPAK